jgi:predicted phosphodiesterase
MKKYVIFSDFHAGDNSAADNFGVSHWNTVKEYIDYYINNGYIVILNGDILEGLQFKYSVIAKKYPGLIELLRKPYVVVVRGNHDEDALKKLGIFFVKEFTIDKTLLVYHGDVYDHPMNTKIVSLALHIYRWFECGIAFVLGKDMPNKIADTPITPTDPRYKGNKSEYIQGAKNRGIEENFKVVVLGHTHEPGSFDYANVKVLNSGTCQCNHCMCVTVEIYDNGDINSELNVVRG